MEGAGIDLDRGRNEMRGRRSWGHRGEPSNVISKYGQKTENLFVNVLGRPSSTNSEENKKRSSLLQKKQKVT